MTKPLLIPLLLYAYNTAASPVEQVHIGLWKSVDSLAVEWVTQQQGGTPVVRWGLQNDSLKNEAKGGSREFTVDPGRSWYTHMAVLDKLEVDTEYYYKVGDAVNGYSDTFKVMNRRKRSEGQPYKHILFGDMGAACAFTLCTACNEKSTVCDMTTCRENTTVGLVSETDADMMLHVGDFAYDLGTDNGTIGDQFFRNIEQIAGTTPYMVSHGNHEDSTSNLAHYIEQWRNMPTNAIPTLFKTANGYAPNTLYFSWDHGLVHYVAISTELWFGVTDGNTTLQTQLDWLKKDLADANKNRNAVPWIVVHGHRSIYCSCDGDCHADAKKVREDMEPILFNFGVDFFINGHEHNYERMWPTYKDKSDQSNYNPKATIYVVTGAAGSHEMHEPFIYPRPSWSAFRSNSFSYSRMFVYNATHIHWQQVQTDPTFFPLHDYGRVIDDTWIVQNHHGPFNPDHAPKAKPSDCPKNLCGSHDHWAPLLTDIDDHSGRDFDVIIREWREKHGDDEWRLKLKELLAIATNGGKTGVQWEDVREDGNSDGAWAYPNGFTWKNGGS